MGIIVFALIFLAFSIHLLRRIILYIAKVVAFIIFDITHLRPLTEEEVNLLAQKRRYRDIASYYSFNPHGVPINLEFKSTMKAEGSFYYINEPVSNIPSCAALLLKYKKFEWLIVAFEKNKIVDLFWVNRGISSFTVHFNLPYERIIDIAVSGNYSTVLIFHNHPNMDPRYFDCTKPSDEDIKSSRELSGMLLKHGINFIAFICERGNYYLYYEDYCKDYFPLKNYIEKIKKDNGMSRSINLELHTELHGLK